MKDMKITFLDTPYDFAGWMKEKSSNVLRDLCCTLQEIPCIKENASFQCAVDDALKIYALCHGNLNGIRCKLVHALLMQHNVDGYYFLSDLVNKTELSPIMHDILQNKRDEGILELIEQNKKENRKKIAEQLAKTTNHNRWMTEVSNDIELVHFGEQPWEWFYEKHCNDRNTFKPYFTNDFFREVYEYFMSEEYENADIY